MKQKLIDYSGDGEELYEQERNPAEITFSHLVDAFEFSPGEIWQATALSGRVHRVGFCDSTNAQSWRDILSGDKINLLVTDPPYNIAENNIVIAKDLDHKSYGALKNSDWDNGFKFEEFGSAIDPFFAPDFTSYVFTSHHLFHDVMMWAADWAKFQNFCVWCKTNPMPSLMKRHWTWSTELVHYATRGAHTFNFPDQGHALNAWNFPKGGGDTGHPTEKPVQVMAHPIKTSSKPGDLVADGFAGSGTIVLAAESTGRRAVCMERDAVWFKVIMDRLLNAGFKIERSTA